MSKISAEWDSAISAIRAKQQQPTYMASAIVSLISTLDRGIAVVAEPIAVRVILDGQSEVLSRAGCERVSPAFQGVYHLSQSAAVWSFMKDGVAADSIH